MIADGRLQAVPSGLVILIIASADGSARRKVLKLDPGGRYRLHYFREAAEELRAPAGSLADEEALRTMAFLETGQVREARQLVAPRLASLRQGHLGDPVAAAAVGYVLLQNWDYEQLEPWCLDLPHEHPWLADGLIIAAEWLAQRGEHATALNYLRQLEHRTLPVFTLGVSRALERLAIYRATAVGERPSVRGRLGEASHRRETISFGQMLQGWDVETARRTYDSFAARALALDLWTPTTAVAEVKEARSRLPEWPALMTQKLVHHIAERAALTRKRRQRGAGPMSTIEKGEVREKRSGLAGLPMYVAMAAILVWVAFIVVMLVASNADENTWTRLTYIFASVEAIAFAAAGALFGVTVQRERVEKAEEKAEKNEDDAASGRALAAINLADEAQLIEQDEESAFEAFGPGQAREAEVRRRHAEAARRLFPNL